MPQRIRNFRASWNLLALVFLAGFAIVNLGVRYCFSALQEKGQEEEPQRRQKSKPQLESKSPQETPDRQKGFTIGVNVDLVVMHTSVYDKNGHFVSGLKKEAFSVFEDGVQQKVSSF